MLRSFWTIPMSLSILAKNPCNHLCDSLLVWGGGGSVLSWLPSPPSSALAYESFLRTIGLSGKAGVCRVHRVLEDKLRAEQEDSLWAAMRWATFLSVGSCI